jgi:putative membrane protein
MAEDEPDYRFTLANERTFLAWIRTALALLAASVVLSEVSTSPDRSARDVRALAVVCALAAILMSLNAFSRWSRIQQAIRRDRPLPSPSFVMRSTVAIVCVSALVCVAVVLP